MLKNELFLILLQIDENMDNTPKEIVDKICSGIIKDVVDSMEIFTNNRTDGEEEHTGSLFNSFLRLTLV